MKKLRVALVNVGRSLPLYPLVTPPLGLMYLAAHLRTKFDAEFLIVNQKLDNLSRDAIVKMVAAFNADVVGYSAITPTAGDLPYLVKAVKQALPGALVVLGGAHVSAFGDKVLAQTNADAGVSGEGELVFEAVIRAYREEAGFSDIPGLFWRDRDGVVHTNPGPAPYVEDLDSLPFPAYDLIDLPRYWQRQGIAPIPKRRYASLFSSRGCPYRCFYCHNVFGKHFRAHSAERIVAEAAHYRDHYGIDEIEFLDDVVNLDHRRLLGFCDGLIRRDMGLKLAFPTALRTDILREEEIDALVAAGMYYCGFSLESGAPRIQRLMGKNLNIERFVENTNKVADRRVYSNGFAMLGFPTETEAEILQTIEVACATRLHTMSFFTVTPFPGTALYDLVQNTCPERMNGVSYENLDFSSFNVNLSDVPDKRFYELERLANRRFFLDPARAFRVLRDYPKPMRLPLYIPHYLKRVTKGLFFNPGTGNDAAGAMAPQNRDTA